MKALGCAYVVMVTLTVVAACSEDASNDPVGGGGGSKAGTGGSAGSGAGRPPAGGDGSGGTAEAGGAGTAGSAGASEAGSSFTGEGGVAGAEGEGGAGGSAGSGGDDEALCADRTGGALVTFEWTSGARLRGWFTSSTFIAQAKQLLASGERTNGVFEPLEGPDCDPQAFDYEEQGQSSWHPDPENAEFADINAEVCDSLPWPRPAMLNGIYCPWGIAVVSVKEQ